MPRRGVLHQGIGGGTGTEIISPGPSRTLTEFLPASNEILEGGYPWYQVPSGDGVYWGVGVDIPEEVGIPEGLEWLYRGHVYQTYNRGGQ